MKIFSQFSDTIDEIYKTDSFFIYTYITNFNSVDVEYSKLSLKVIEILFFDIIMYRTMSKIHKGSISSKIKYSQRHSTKYVLILTSSQNLLSNIRYNNPIISSDRI